MRCCVNDIQRSPSVWQEGGEWNRQSLYGADDAAGILDINGGQYWAPRRRTGMRLYLDIEILTSVPR